jgi:hypothetical protein
MGDTPLIYPDVNSLVGDIPAWYGKYNNVVTSLNCMMDAGGTAFSLDDIGGLPTPGLPSGTVTTGVGVSFARLRCLAEGRAVSPGAAQAQEAETEALETTSNETTAANVTAAWATKRNKRESWLPFLWAEISSLATSGSLAELVPRWMAQSKQTTDNVTNIQFSVAIPEWVSNYVAADVPVAPTTPE